MIEFIENRLFCMPFPVFDVEWPYVRIKTSPNNNINCKRSKSNHSFLLLVTIFLTIMAFFLLAIWLLVLHQMTSLAIENDQIDGSSIYLNQSKLVWHQFDDGNQSVPVTNFAKQAKNVKTEQLKSESSENKWLSEPSTPLSSLPAIRSQSDNKYDISREYHKQNRLFQIMSVMAQLAGRPPPPTPKWPSSLSESKDSNDRIIPNYNNPEKPKTTDWYAKRLQSFHPICSPPNFIVDVWNHQMPNKQQNFLSFYFNVSISKSTDPSTVIKVNWAKLKLFKFSGGVFCSTNHISTTTSDIQDQKTRLEHRLSLCDPNRDDNRKLIISIHQYVWPTISNNYERTRFIDSQMVLALYRGPLEFNLQNVVANDWTNRNGLPNLGLMVKIEDQLSKQFQNTSQHIIPMNCSDPSSKSFVFPNLEPSQMIKLGLTQFLENYRPQFNQFPILSLETIETNPIQKQFEELNENEAKSSFQFSVEDQF